MRAHWALEQSEQPETVGNSRGHRAAESASRLVRTTEGALGSRGRWGGKGGVEGSWRRQAAEIASPAWPARAIDGAWPERIALGDERAGGREASSGCVVAAEQTLWIVDVARTGDDASERAIERTERR